MQKEIKKDFTEFYNSADRKDQNWTRYHEAIKKLGIFVKQREENIKILGEETFRRCEFMALERITECAKDPKENPLIRETALKNLLFFHQRDFDGYLKELYKFIINNNNPEDNVSDIQSLARKNLLLLEPNTQ